jgi:tetratricopeptide (TPR) repeat protein
VPRTRSASTKPPVSQPIAFGSVSLIDLAIGAVLILTIFTVYFQVGTFDFISYDDNQYVTENTRVLSGLTPGNIRWALTAVVVSNWMPVTILSHMLDCQLFHQQSGVHHLVNVLFHALATLLLFASLKRASGARGASAFVALLFAVHPLHVESVAWVAERKDVLSAFFWFLALYGYVRYAEHPTVRGYLPVVLAFALGLMAKPMLVTFPFTLLLLDAWPLHRTKLPGTLYEKLPLFALSAAASCVTYFVQGSTGAFRVFPLPVRIENALISYVVYIGQMLWPVRLAVLYPYQESLATWQAAAAAMILVALTAAVIFAWRTRPYLAVGWFWYLGTLVPVIGLVQVGQQAHADRYMYIPMVGLLLMLAWGASELQAKWPRAKMACVLAAAACGIACVWIAHAQTEYWQNTGTLFEHALSLTRDNYMAEYTLGNYLMNTRRGLEAIPHFEAALRVAPNYPDAHNNLGMVLGNIPGHMTEAISEFEEAVRLKPDLLPAQHNLAVALEQMPGRKSEALAHYEVIERLQPSPEIAGIIKRLRAEQK